LVNITILDKEYYNLHVINVYKHNIIHK